MDGRRGQRTAAFQCCFAARVLTPTAPLAMEQAPSRRITESQQAPSSSNCNADRIGFRLIPRSPAQIAPPTVTAALLYRCCC